jgi:mevalonate kinase
MITATAPGKIHLLGEHTSVYGKPALLAAIDKSVSVSIESAKNGKGFSEHGKDREELEQVLLSAIKKKFTISKIPKYKIEIKTDLPIGSGLGSSAAFSAASAAVLLTFLNLPNDKETIFEIAYEGEKFFHGNPSGGDLAAVVNAGLTFPGAPGAEFYIKNNQLVFRSGTTSWQDISFNEQGAEIRRLFQQTFPSSEATSTTFISKSARFTSIKDDRSRGCKMYEFTQYTLQGEKQKAKVCIKDSVPVYVSTP